MNWTNFTYRECVACGKRDVTNFPAPNNHVCSDRDEGRRRGGETLRERYANRDIEQESYYGTRLGYGFWANGGQDE